MLPEGFPFHQFKAFDEAYGHYQNTAGKLAGEPFAFVVS